MPGEREFPGPYPGYTGVRPKTCTALPRIFSENGYATGGFGKWHLTQDNVQEAAGPFDNWPPGWGFNHWWGFLSGAAGQYDPIITQDNSVLGVPEGKGGGLYYFPDDLTDKAIEWLHAVRAQDAEKPWMMYYSTGCAHAPHHVAKEWADRYKGKFDHGWGKLREDVFARQKQLGVIPQDAELTERPDIFPAWDSLTDAQRRLYARQMEVFAGFSKNADWNVGRLLDAIEEMGDLDIQDGTGVTSRSVSPEGCGRFLIDIFEEWVRRDIGEVYVQMFDTTLANWAGEHRGMCVHCETCGLALALEHTGDVYSCDHFVEPRYLLGNISDRPLAELVSSSNSVRTSAKPFRATAGNATFDSPATAVARRTASRRPRTASPASTTYVPASSSSSITSRHRCE